MRREDQLAYLIATLDYRKNLDSTQCGVLECSSFIQNEHIEFRDVLINGRIEGFKTRISGKYIFGKAKEWVNNRLDGV
jgi:hypothetical protein